MKNTFLQIFLSLINLEGLKQFLFDVFDATSKKRESKLMLVIF